MIFRADPAAATTDGVALSPKRLVSRPPWSKKNARPCVRVRSSGRPASKTITEDFSWRSAQATSTGRVASMNRRSRVRGCVVERVHPRAARREQGPVRRPDVFFKRDGRIEQTGAADARGEDVRDARGASTRSLARRAPRGACGRVRP